MAKRSVTLEWEVAREDRAWTQREAVVEWGQAADEDGCARRPAWRRLVLVAASALLLLIFSCAGFVLWRQAQAGYQQVERDIRETIELEAWSSLSDNRAVGAAVMDADASEAWLNQIAEEQLAYADKREREQVTIVDMGLEDDLAMVTLKVAQPGAGPTDSYRLTRFYHEVDGTWLRSTPRPQLLGASEKLATDYFVFSFRQKDRAAVQAAAARVDAIYAQLRRDVALAESPAGKLKIDVAMQIPTDDYLQVDQEQITVLSPLLQKIPEGITDADILSQSIVHQLVRRVMHEAQVRKAIHYEWYLLLEGIQLWQAYGGSDSLSEWQTEISSWLYHDAAAIRRGEREPTVTDLARLCRIHFVWGHTLALQPSPAMLCQDTAWRSRLRYMRLAPQTLEELVYQPESNNSGYRRSEGYWMERVAAATVIEYLVENYGREQVPALLSGMQEYDTWDELAAGVLNIMAEEFENGWILHINRMLCGRKTGAGC